MTYVVKYIGNCAKNNIDILPLYENDLRNGDKVILVCEEETVHIYDNLNIYRADSYKDIPNCTANPIMLCGGGDARALAVLCAAACYAVECQVYIKNKGFFTADPSQLDIAVKLEKIDYDEVMEICSSGYNVLDNYMVEAAKRHGVIIHILSYLTTNEKGTLIKEVLGDSSMIVKGVIKDPNIAIITLKEIPDRKGVSYEIFKAVSDAGIVVDIILLPAADAGKQDISFTVQKNNRRTVERVLREKQQEIGFSDILINDNVAKISVIGAALQETFGVATTVFKVLYENDISLRLINTSEIKIAVVIDKDQSDLAVHKIHEAFIN